MAARNRAAGRRGGVGKKSARFDPRFVAEAIAAAGARERAGQAYGEIGMALKKAFSEARRQILKNYARGDVIGEKLSDVADEAVRAIYELTKKDATLSPDAVAICATGGYGRRLLAPHSDVDLLILHKSMDENALRPTVDAILYPLWDSGITVGHAVHTPKSAVALAREDLTPCTAFLDARFLCGDEKIFNDFENRYDRLRRTTKKKFTREKLAEQDARHERSQQSRYLAEPDIKESKGGLRDIHTIRWLYKYVYDKPIEKATSRGRVLKPDEVEAIKRAERFLMSLRVHLHDLRDRPDDKLTFDIQPALAERLGYADRQDMTASERMMKHYFLNAVDVGRLTRIFCAKLEEHQNQRLPGAPRPLPNALASDEAGGKPNLRLHNGRLDFQSGAKAIANPIDFFRLFRAFAKRPDIDFHPNALAVITDNVSVVTTEVRRDPAVARVFLAMLVDAGDVVKLLRVMGETGLLGKYIPSFGQIAGRIEIGLYRRFALDEHIFQSIGFLKQLMKGEHKREHPVATNVLAKARNPATFYIAVLLHEAGWSLKNRTTDNAERLVGRVARRLGASDKDASMIAWCAARPLFMVRIAERRNLGEARTIAKFAAEVETRERLDLLVVLSVCHIRIVSEGAWDKLTRARMIDLYEGSCVWLRSGDEGLNKLLEDRAAKARTDLGAALDSWPAREREMFLGRLSDEMVSTLDAEALTRVAALARSASKNKEAAGVAASVRDELIEAIVYADDRTGLLADLAGAVASTGASVKAVHAMTTNDGKAIDFFSIQAPEGVELEREPDLVRNVHKALLAAAKAPLGAPVEPSRRIGDRRDIFDVEPLVRLDLDASEDYLVVEAEGRDRPGLLYDLAAALVGIGVIIKSAHIATYGERAVDAFYLQDAPGYKITNKRRQQSIERRLLAVLSDD